MPTAADLRTRYPAFAAAPDATVDMWLADAALVVAPDWADADAAIMALAAHRMAQIGLDGSQPGVTSFRSGSFAVTMDGGGKGLSGTAYGRAYLDIARAHGALVALPRVY